jgi:hypothetical protein
MEQQELIDKEFLERLERAYSVELANLQARISVARRPRFDPMTAQTPEPPTTIIVELTEHLPRDEPRAAQRRGIGALLIVSGTITELYVILYPGSLLFTIPLGITFILIGLSFALSKADAQPRAIANIPLVNVEPDYIQALRKEITELKTALTEVKAELERLARKQPDRVMSQFDCVQWTQLLHIHVQFIRHLELDQAKMGADFPIFKRIDLDERRKWAYELKQQIAANCQGSIGA